MKIKLIKKPDNKLSWASERVGDIFSVIYTNDNENNICLECTKSYSVIIEDKYMTIGQLCFSDCLVLEDD